MKPPHIIKDFLKSRDFLIQNELRQEFGRSVTQNYTDLMDRFIFALFQDYSAQEKFKEVEEGRMAVMALGSYGRSELCLESDIDLLIVHQGSLSNASRKVVTSILYPLWDAKLEVGHSVLSVQECNGLAVNDFRFLTSVIDARFLLGSKPFFRLFREAFWSRVLREKDSLLKKFLINQQKREEKYGGQSYFVEPDIKEGLGGLRDIHFMAWMARIYFRKKRLSQIRHFEVFSHFETNKLNYSKKFLLKVRNQLHLLAGRKEDRLLLSYQNELSRRLGYREGQHISGAGKFMRQYYLHMNRIRYGHEEFNAKVLDMIDPQPFDSTPISLPPEFQIMKGNVVLKKGYLLQEDPLLILKAFNLANRNGLFLGSGFIWEARKRIAIEGKELIELPGAKELFVQLMFEYRNPKIFRLALEIGLIDIFIPEYKKIRNLAQFSYYHMETVDLHSLKTLEVLHSISLGSYDEKRPIFCEVFRSLQHPEWLFIAGLLHDIGKGYRGDHYEKGAILIPRILKRLGIESNARMRIPFLVENHLLLTNISQRRDLNEEKTSVQAAQILQSTENLHLLFLLTVSDSIATGPMARSDWKISLLIELFLKVRNILESGILATPDATKQVDKKKSKIHLLLKDKFSQNKIQDLLDQVSTRYFLNTPLNGMSKHFNLALTMGKNTLSWDLRKRTSAPVTEVNLCTYDRPGLFCKMVGVFTLNNIKVLSAKIFTLKNGLAFDTYDVTNPVDPYFEEQRWLKIKEEVIWAIEGRMALDDLIKKKNKNILGKKGPFIEHKTRVRVDNSESDFFTILEVSGSERFGLLYELAKKMFSLGLNIRFAKVNRDEEKMTGVFYIRDDSGQKVYDGSTIEMIKNEIHVAMTP